MSSTEPLEGKVAVITGASRGIGAATARAFSAAGASVALAARDEAALDALADELSSNGNGAIAVPTDVGDAEIPAMLESGGGAIVNMSSTAGTEAVGGLAGYTSAKHGVIGLTKTAALDYASRGVRVNAVAPGPILTENLERAGPEMQERAGLAMPMRRIGQPEEVARAVVWLCSDQASFTTGVTLPIDGGKLAGMAPFGAPRE